ncbi:guanine deaminase [Pontibacter sp. JAM-7]|uniref:guanine deaminase n=1 Tax=Pontibacter sp. JAM-7 TaxID=3366581 RepID=UPI003AF63C8E
MKQCQAFRGRVLHFTDNPQHSGEAAYEYWSDGMLLVADGKIHHAGDWNSLASKLPAGTECIEYPHHLLIPGFVDSHIHYPQTEMIAAYGEQLLDWLQRYTFPVEMQFADPDHCAAVARWFLDELLRNGTTTAMVFCTVHPTSVDALFQEAWERRLRLIAGKVLMDRNAPEALLEDAETGYQSSQQLIERWHGVDRLSYAVTPRFAPTSSSEQLALAGKLLKQYPGLYLQTHLSENLAELAWVKDLYPDARHYLDVYAQAGLLGPRSVFAHGIHLCADEWNRLAETDSVLAHCPSSNLFLGSGLFDLQQAQASGVRLGMGTDVGAGTSFSMLQTLADAYKVQQLQGVGLEPLQALYMATLGGARALSLDHLIGSFQPGYEADFTVLDLHATPLIQQRLEYCRELKDLLFVLQTLGDDRCVAATYILGQCLYQRL